MEETKETKNSPFIIKIKIDGDFESTLKKTCKLQATKDVPYKLKSFQLVEDTEVAVLVFYPNIENKISDPFVIKFTVDDDLHDSFVNIMEMQLNRDTTRSLVGMQFLNNNEILLAVFEVS